MSDAGPEKANAAVRTCAFVGMIVGLVAMMALPTNADSVLAGAIGGGIRGAIGGGGGAAVGMLVGYLIFGRK